MKGITDTEIIVANSAPMSGPYIASGDPMNAGIRSYFRHGQCRRRHRRKKDRFLHQDDGNDPVKGREILENFSLTRFLHTSAILAQRWCRPLWIE